MARVVVVGGGVGGLTAAARLAALGHTVEVHERSEVVGGKLGLVEWELGAGTFRFDTGPHLVTMPQVFEETFRATGVPSPLRLERLDPLCRYRFADGTRLDAVDAVDTPDSPERFAANLAAALGPDAAADWARLYGRAAAMWRATEDAFLRSPVSAATLLRLSRNVGDIPTIAPWRTLRGLGTTSLRDPRLRTFLDRYATYTGSDPRRAPAVLATVPYVEQRYGGWYATGGLRTIGDALLQRCGELGVTVRTGSAVTGIELAGGRVAGVRVAGGRPVVADLVVANADAAHVYGHLLPRTAPVRRAQAAMGRAEPSLSGFVLLLALSGTTPGLAHHTVLFPEDYDAEFDAVFGRGAAGRGAAGRGAHRARPVPDPTLYVSAPPDPAIRPAGHEAWFVLVNAPRHGTGRDGTVDWDAPGVAPAYAEQLLDLLARRGLDVRHRILRMAHRSPADLERATGAPGGAIYGTSSNGPRASFLRPANRSPVPGLFLVGGSSHPGGGLPLVTVSGAIVAGLVGPA